MMLLENHELFGWYPVHIAFADYQAVSEKLAGTIFEVEQSLEPEPFGERVASNTVIGTEGGHDIFVVLVYAGEDFPSVYPVGTGQFDVLFEVVDRVDTLVPVVGVGRWAEAEIGFAAPVGPVVQRAELFAAGIVGDFVVTETAVGQNAVAYHELGSSHISSLAGRSVPASAMSPKTVLSEMVRQ